MEVHEVQAENSVTTRIPNEDSAQGISDEAEKNTTTAVEDHEIKIHPMYVNLWKNEFKELFRYKDLLDDVKELCETSKNKLEQDKQSYLSSLESENCAGDKQTKLDSLQIKELKKNFENFPALNVQQKQILFKIQKLCDEIEFSLHSSPV